MTLQEFFQINWFLISIFIFMSIVFIANYRFEQKLTKKFIIPLTLLILCMLVENIDTIMVNNTNTSLLHMFIAILDYTLLLMIIVSLAYIIIEKEKYKYKKMLNILLIICIVISIIILLLSLLTKQVFWYDNDGNIIKTPVSYIPHLVFIAYMVFLVQVSIRRIMRGYKEEGAIIITGVVLNICAVSAQTILNTKGIIIGTTALFVTFYYLYLHIQIFKLDTLTGCLNRMTMKADSLKYKNKLKALIMVDLNNLKELNDNYGHETGDTALKTLVKTVKKCMPRGCRLYRSGGDEFVIFIPINVRKSAIEIEQNIYDAMKTTEYTWATGSAEFSTSETEFEVVLSKADRQMYHTKNKMKQGGAR